MKGVDEGLVTKVNIKKWLSNFLPEDMGLALLLTVICNFTVYCGSRLLMQNRRHFDLTLAMDEQIPFVPWTLSIYFGCYLFWIANYLIAARQERGKAVRFLSADIMAKLICLVCFVVLPTTNTRPEVIGDSVWHMGMRFLYEIDAADNLFPSIHCLTSWFGWIAVRNNEKIPKGYRLGSLVFALMVCISTLTTKQHVLVDVFAGVGLAEFCYWFTAKTGFVFCYEHFLCRLRKLLTGKMGTRSH